MILAGRRVQISGSANSATQPEIVRYGHAIVGNVVRGVLRKGGGLVLTVGREPRANADDHDLPSLVFDWTAIETAAHVLDEDGLSWPEIAGSRIVVVASEKSLAEIPEDRRDLWRRFLTHRAVQLEQIMTGSRAAALIRQRQARFGNILLALGGGTGVEHLADLYMARARPVIPLDLPLGASRNDGTGGALRLARESLTEPQRFLRLKTGHEGRAAAELAGLATREGAEPDTQIAQRLLALFEMLADPTAFFVRLLNKKHPRFSAVESFFRGVVDPVVAELGLERIEIGTDEAKEAFLNVEIFNQLHFADVALVDLTGSRPCCFIELGYALGRGSRVILTAEDGTEVPFDGDAIPRHHWNEATADADRRRLLGEFWQRTLNRPPIVESRTD